MEFLIQTQLFDVSGEWARPIFNLQSDYRSLTKDERVKRDYDHMPLAKKRRMRYYFFLFKN